MCFIPPSPSNLVFLRKEVVSVVQVGLSCLLCALFPKMSAISDISVFTKSQALIDRNRILFGKSLCHPFRISVARLKIIIICFQVLSIATAATSGIITMTKQMSLMRDINNCVRPKIECNVMRFVCPSVRPNEDNNFSQVYRLTFVNIG